MFQAIQKLFGSSDERYINRAAMPMVAKINALEESIKKLRDWASSRARPASTDTRMIDMFGANS